MRADCHMHMVLDGYYWRAAIERHKAMPHVQFIREMLQRYRQEGFTYLRDGGDRWGVGKLARKIAPEYGIVYRTPLAPLCKEGHYGGFIGKRFSDLKEYAALVAQTKAEGGDFIKIMISGLMDFDRAGVLTEEGLSAGEIREMIHIAHQEGFAVMAHANGARTAEAAAVAGVDSVEHGAYLDRDTLEAMAAQDVIWVPTLSTIGNLRGKGRFSEDAVEAILESAMENVNAYAQMGGSIAPGSDAGAWQVYHSGLQEYGLLEQAIGTGWENVLKQGIRKVRQKF